VLAGLYGTANISYAGGKNSTYIDGIATNRNAPAVVNYFNSGTPAEPAAAAAGLHWCVSEDEPDEAFDGTLSTPLMPVVQVMARSYSRATWTRMA
jgi:hypothetical protein